MKKGFFTTFDITKMKNVIYIIILFSVFNCQDRNNIYDISNDNHNTSNNKPLHISKKERTPIDSGFLEKYLVSKGLINIHSLDSSIRVKLLYSTSNNFLNRNIYRGLENCYLPCEVAIKLCNAQFFLKQDYPEYNLIVFDAARPLYIQKEMWDSLGIPAQKKINYLAHPNETSLHNYGAAVDVGIIGNNHLLLDMGTGFDCFDSLSQPKQEMHFFQNHRLSAQQLMNRLILRRVMEKAGFTPITSEWWHFNATNKVTAAYKYELIQ